MPNLAAYLTVSSEMLADSIGRIEHELSIANFDATLRFHYLKFDAAGEPQTNELARKLSEHIVDYCLSARRRQDLALINASRLKLIEDARRLFRRAPTSGETGEMLLYFFLEAILQAPQLVAKMSLKDNPNAEILGSDGIHGKYDACADTLDLYFGEAKLYQQISGALDAAFQSIEDFHANGILQDELPLISNQFKHLDESGRIALLKFLEDEDSETTVRTNHALLIGFNWSKYQRLAAPPGAELLDEFLAALRNKIQEWRDLLQTRFDRFPHRDLHFESFLLPFKSVQSFRTEFLQALDNLR